MVQERLLIKDKIGQKGARSKYRPASRSFEFKANEFFNHVRDYTEKSDLVLRKDGSFIVYGLPSSDKIDERLTPIERKVLEQNLSQIENAFFNLFRLKKSISAREKSNQPLYPDLLWNYVLQEIANETRDGIRLEVLWSRTRNDVEKTLELAEKRGFHIEDAGELLKIEKQWFDPNLQTLSQGLLSNIDDSSLAALIMTPPSEIQEYDLFNWLREIMKKPEAENLEDKDLFYLAEEITLRARLRGRPMSIGDINRLKNWPWLKKQLDFDDQKLEKLAKCLYYLSKSDKKARVSIGNTEPQQAEIKIIKEGDKEEWKKAINCRLPE